MYSIDSVFKKFNINPDLAVLIKDKDINVLKQLVEEHGNEFVGYMLYVVVNFENIEQVKYLCDFINFKKCTNYSDSDEDDTEGDSDEDDDDKDDIEGDEYNYCILEAIRGSLSCKNLDILQFLLTKYEFTLKEVNHYNIFIDGLHDLEITKWLTSHFDIKKDRTILMNAVHYGDISILEYLIEKYDYTEDDITDNNYEILSTTRGYGAFTWLVTKFKLDLTAMAIEFMEHLWEERKEDGESYKGLT